VAHVKVFVLGLSPPNPCNLIQDCLRAHLFDPRYVSHSDLMIQIDIVHHKLCDLAKDTPALHCKHLLDLQQATDDRGDSTRSDIILEIFTREQEQKMAS
jgi:hypothetical protein